MRAIDVPPEVRASIATLAPRVADLESTVREVLLRIVADEPVHGRRCHPLVGQLLGWHACEVGEVDDDPARTVMMVYHMMPSVVHVVAVGEHDLAYREAQRIRAQKAGKASRTKHKMRRIK